jgi:hypothetical protein
MDIDTQAAICQQLDVGDNCDTVLMLINIDLLVVVEA